MATRGRLMATPTIYEVGTDIPQDQWTTLIMKVGDWFAETRPDLKEPNVVARQTLDCCLKGVKPSDPTQQWKGVERSTLSSRIKIACRFDIDTMQGLRTANEKTKAKKEREKERTAEKRKKNMDDPNIPDAIRKELQKSAAYGDDPRVFLSTEEAKRWQELHDAYVKDFPELGGVSAASELNVLCDLLVVSDRQRLKILKGEKVDSIDQQGITNQIVTLKKALNIHPEQLAKRVQKQTAGTVGELIRRLEEMKNWREIRAMFFTEELLTEYQMYMTPSPRENMGGYQLDEVGLFGMTRCRTCECARCGHRNFAGLSIEEIETYLIDKDVLRRIPTPVDTALGRQPDMYESTEPDADAQS